MTTVAGELWDGPASAPRSTSVPVPVAPRVPVPCAARPGTTLWHLDGPCRCFVGGPAPEFAPSTARA
ncbi:hypothetical protein AB6N23_15830 [Cellulomonas sp. 179-A 9B4 NHS]|uniref:hypothetical protein n=1 Tax=Cellulomonas sp. 179-A 9B4 NHS TaxID=3142379 RepID=UPI0039A285B0